MIEAPRGFTADRRTEECDPQITQMGTDLKTEEQRRIIDRINTIHRMNSLI
jgi:hypothetical protein